MNITTNGTLGSFLLAVLVYVLFGAAVDELVKDEPAHKTFKLVLLVVCLVLALAGSVFIKI